ncbi:MAG: hypothetical protein GY729_11410 [Desulfobacteraceae bacterium]|nr:hypothetical protein [Desulfobacteraceae bacterium]
MAQAGFSGLKIVNDQGATHDFETIIDFQINMERGVVIANLADGMVSFMLDRLCYFHLGLPPQEMEIAFASCDVQLKSISGDPPQTVHIEKIINYDWKIDQGLFMVFAKEATFGFHLDHVISYQVHRSAI